MTPEQQLVFDYLKAYTQAPDSCCMPFFVFSVYDIDNKQVLSRVYRARHGFEWVKVANNQVVEHYRQMDMNKGLFGINLIPGTREVFEEYVIEEPDLVKYNMAGEEVGRTTNIQRFSELPPDFRESLQDFTPKGRIIYWARKSTRVVGVAAEI